MKVWSLSRRMPPSRRCAYLVRASLLQPKKRCRRALFTSRSKTKRFAGPSLSAAKTAPLFCAACVSHFCLLWRQVAYKSNGCRSDVGHRWWWNPFRTGKVRGARSRGPVFIFGWRRHEKFYLKPPLSAAGIYLHTLRPNTCNLSPLNGHQSFQGPFCLTWRGNSHQKVPQQGSMS